jgi:hypothetical protein
LSTKEGLYSDPFDFIERDFVGGAVVELGGAGALVRGDGLRILERATVSTLQERGIDGMTDYLAELLKDTPMGRMKLLAAWDSLSTETRIELLAELVARNRVGSDDRAIFRRGLAVCSSSPINLPCATAEVACEPAHTCRTVFEFIHLLASAI